MSIQSSSRLRKLLEDSGHRITEGRLGQLIRSGELEAARTSPGGNYLVDRPAVEKMMRERGGKPARTKPKKPRKPAWDVDRSYFRFIEKRYGITGDEYRALCEANDYRCTICGQRPDEVRTHLHIKARRLNIDHDHLSGEIRGLLCQRCNTHVTFAGENVVMVRRLLDYLEGRLAPPEHLEVLGGKRYKRSA